MYARVETTRGGGRNQNTVDRIGRENVLRKGLRGALIHLGLSSSVYVLMKHMNPIVQDGDLMYRSLASLLDQESTPTV